MSSHRHVFSSLCLWFIALHITGCMTNNVLSKAKYDRKNDKVTAIRSAYFDSEKALVINFSAKLDGYKKAAYHVIIPIDSLLVLFDHAKTLDYVPDSLTSSNHKFNRIYRVLEGNVKKEGYGTCIELPRNALLQGQYVPIQGDSVKGTIVNYSNKVEFSAHPLTDSNDVTKRWHAHHPVFAYYFPTEDSARYQPFQSDYIAISIEPSSRKRYNRYALVPLTAAGDLVTLPFQAIGYGAALLMGAAMGF